VHSGGAAFADLFEGEERRSRDEGVVSQGGEEDDVALVEDQPDRLADGGEGA
jgi:hypothetical protein